MFHCKCIEIMLYSWESVQHSLPDLPCLCAWRAGIIQAAQVLQMCSIKVRQLVMFFRVMCHSVNIFAMEHQHFWTSMSTYIFKNCWYFIVNVLKSCYIVGKECNIPCLTCHACAHGGQAWFRRLKDYMYVWCGRICTKQCHWSYSNLNVQLGHGAFLQIRMNNLAPASIETEMRSSISMESEFIQ